MNKKKSLLFISALVFVSAALLSWGIVGHRAIGKIAENHLDPKAKMAVQELLGSQSLADVATWADEVRPQPEYKHTGGWHFINLPLGLVAFAATYFLTERANGAYFSQPLTRSSALYFSMTVFSTVGFGDITAKADPARLIVTAQMFFDLILLGFGARVFLGAVKLGRQRHAPDQPERQES